MGLGTSRQTDPALLIMNWTPDDDQERALYSVYNSHELPLPLASSLMLRTTTVRDQLSLGSSCVHALLDAYEMAVSAPFPLSRMFVYHNERHIQQSSGKTNGASICDTVKSIEWYGVCKENDWPYNLDLFDVQPPDHIYDGASSTKDVVEFSTIIAQDVSRALQEGYPVVVGLQMYDCYASAIDGNFPTPTSSSTIVGGHAVLIFGYDNTSSRFTFKNSRGSSWGVDGRGTIPFSSLQNPRLVDSMWIVRKVSESQILDVDTGVMHASSSADDIFHNCSSS